MFLRKPTVTKHGRFNCFEKVLLRVGGQVAHSSVFVCAHPTAKNTEVKGLLYVLEMNVASSCGSCCNPYPLPFQFKLPGITQLLIM